MKRIILLIMLFFLVLPILAKADTLIFADPGSAGDAQTNCLGYNVTATSNVNMVNVTIKSGVTTNYVYIYNKTGGSVMSICNQSISSSQANFSSTCILIANNYYAICAGLNAGTSYTRKYTASPAFPKTSPNLRSTSQVEWNWASTWGFDTGYGSNLVSIDAANYSEPPSGSSILNVTLNEPSNNLFTSSGTSIKFNATPTWYGDALYNFSLYGNFTGTWQLNLTNTSIVTNATKYSITQSLNQGTFTWNYYAWNSTNIVFAASNYTITVDSTAPTYSKNSTTSTTAGQSCTFSLEWDDNVKMTSGGGFIFSTNNSGGWKNNTWAGFSSMPQNATNTSILNATVGLPVAWCMYANDTTSNWGSSCSSPYILTTIANATWLNDYSYRVHLVITNPDNAGINNMSVNATLNTASLISSGKMQSDCDDIRITNSANTIYPLIAIDKCNDAASNLTFQANYEPLEAKDVYVYYGNPSAAAYNSSWSSVYWALYDDLASYDSSKWTIKNATAANYVYFDGNYAVMNKTENGIVGSTGLLSNIQVQKNGTYIETSLNGTIGSGLAENDQFWIRASNISTWNWFSNNTIEASFAYSSSYTPYNFLIRAVNRTTVETLRWNESAPNISNAFMTNLTLQFNSTNFKIFLNSSLRANSLTYKSSMNDTPQAYVACAGYYAPKACWVDYIKIRFVSLTEPSISYGSEETNVFLPTYINLNSPTDNGINNSLTINFYYTPISYSIDVLNCSLWTNETSWSLKHWNASAIVNNTQNYIQETLSTVGAKLWNIGCYNTTGLIFAVSNRSLMIDQIAPVFSSNTTSSTYAGMSSTQGITVTDNYALSGGGYIFSTNNSGGWVNTSWTSLATNPQTVSSMMTLNSVVGATVSWKFYANDSANNWNVSSTYNINTTSVGNTNIGVNISSVVAGEINFFKLDEALFGTITSIDLKVYTPKGNYYSYTKPNFHMEGTQWVMPFADYWIMGNYTINGTVNGNSALNFTAWTNVTWQGFYETVWHSMMLYDNTFYSLGVNSSWTGGIGGTCPKPQYIVNSQIWNGYPIYRWNSTTWNEWAYNASVYGWSGISWKMFEYNLGYPSNYFNSQYEEAFTYFGSSKYGGNPPEIYVALEGLRKNGISQSFGGSMSWLGACSCDNLCGSGSSCPADNIQSRYVWRNVTYELLNNYMPEYLLYDAEGCDGSVMQALLIDLINSVLIPFNKAHGTNTKMVILGINGIGGVDNNVVMSSTQSDIIGVVGWSDYNNPVTETTFTNSESYGNMWGVFPNAKHDSRYQAGGLPDVSLARLNGDLVNAASHHANYLALFFMDLYRDDTTLFSSTVATNYTTARLHHGYTVSSGFSTIWAYYENNNKVNQTDAIIAMNYSYDNIVYPLVYNTANGLYEATVPYVNNTYYVIDAYKSGQVYRKSQNRILDVNGTSSNMAISSNSTWAINYPTGAYITTSGCPSSCTCNFYRNDSTITSPDTNLFGVGSYYYVYNTSGCTGYPANSVNQTLVVSQGVNQVTLSFDGYLNQNRTYSYPATTTALATSLGGTASIYRDGTAKSNNETIQFGVGIYQYKANATGNTNWTTNATGLTYYIIITAGSASLSLANNASTWSINYGQAINVTGSGCPSGATCVLYRDGTNVSNPDINSFVANSYVYIYNSTAIGNYSITNANNTLIVNKASPGTLVVSSSPSWAVQAGTETTVTGSGCPAVESILCQLYRNGVGVSNPDIQILGTGAYAYIYNSTSSQNYTSLSVTNTLAVITGTPSMLNISGVYDEDNISVSLTFDVQVYNSSFSNSTTGVTSYTNSDIRGDITIIISATGYGTRYYHASLGETGTYNMTGYLVNSTVGHTVSFTIKNQNGQLLEDANMIISKLLPTWEVVTHSFSDSAGMIAFFANPTTNYKIGVSKNGYENKNFSIMLTSTAYEIYLTGSTYTGNYTPTVWEGISYFITPSGGGISNKSTVFNFTIISNDSQLQWWGMNVTHGNGTTLCSYNYTNAFGGTAACVLDLTNETGQNITVQTFFKKQGYTAWYDPIIVFINQWTSSGLYKILTDIGAMEPIAVGLLSIIIALMVVGVGTTSIPFGTKIGSGVIMLAVFAIFIWGIEAVKGVGYIWSWGLWIVTAIGVFAWYYIRGGW